MDIENPEAYSIQEPPGEEAANPDQADRARCCASPKDAEA